MSTQSSSVCFLFDNGSVRADSTLSLRAVARALAARIGCRVEPVSLLHSSKIPAEALHGVSARLLEPALLAELGRQPTAEIVLLPLFFGPSAALTEYVPARLVSVRAQFPAARIQLAPPLVNVLDADRRLAQVLADRVRAVIAARDLKRPCALLIDHGSPQAQVAAVRDHLGRQVAAELGDEISAFAVASMERRDGDAYAFNDPLLAAVLSRPPFNQGDVVVALQFLSPGRHAGAGGDIATICAEAEVVAEAANATSQSRLKTHMTQPIVGDARLVEVLAERFAQAQSVG